MSAAANPRTSTPDFPPEFLNEIERTVMNRGGQPKGGEIAFRCPNSSNHQNGDKDPSAQWNRSKCAWYCYVCGQGGGALDLADRLGIDKPERRRNGPTLKAVPPPNLTLAEYAAAKGLPERFLHSIGCTDAPYLGGNAVRMVYPDDDGGESSVRYRISLKKPAVGDRFRWKTGSKAHPYGLDRIPDAEQAGRILLLEGESCTQTSWYRGFPALGIPGAANWKNERDAPHLANIPVICAVIEPDGGGDTFRAKLLASPSLRDRLYFIDLSPYGVKDVSDLYLDDPDTFDERMEEAIAAATPATEWATPDSPADKMPVAFPTTDTGNAERLVAQHGQDIRFNWGRGVWHVWTGTHWGEDVSGRMDQLAKETVRAIPEEAKLLEDEARAKMLRHAASSESAGKRSAMVELARSEDGIPVLPEELDADPWLLNVANGTLDLRTGALRSHDRANLITRCLTTAYLADATCPTFMAFLDRIFAGNTELITYVQRMVGYSLTGSTREQAILIAHGNGSNGKSTLLGTIATLLEGYAAEADTDSFLEKQGDRIREDVAALDGARFVAASETADGKRLSEAFIKKATGGEKLRARRLFENGYVFMPRFKIWLSTNHRPQIIGTDHAIWRRIRLLPFTVTIPDNERDRDLPAKLGAELPGILAWAVEGCRQWLHHGEQPPPAVLQATEQYRRDMDALANWLEDRCEMRSGLRETPKALYASYMSYCELAGEEPLKQKTFGTRLTERGYGEQKSSGVRYRTGIRLRDPNEPSQATFEEDMSPQRDVTSPPPSDEKAYGFGDSSELRDTRDIRDTFSRKFSSNNTHAEDTETYDPYSPYVPPGESGDDPWTR